MAGIPTKPIEIGNREIGAAFPPFVIAEMSGNHNQSLEQAIKIVDAASDAGADALKLQTYTPDTMTLDLDEGDFFIANPKSLWKGKSLYQLYREAHTPWEWHKPIFDRCRERGLLYVSTPFDASAVDFLCELEVPFFKIASFENTDLPLIRRVAATGKPLVISCGMATLAELEETVGAARTAGCDDLILLKCTSSYPASPEYSNLRTIPHLRELFHTEVGLSDHTLGIGVSLAAIALGAAVIEKHFTLDRSQGGVDSAFSLDPHELKALVQEAKRVWQSLGEVHYGLTTEETASRAFRRTIYVTENVKTGDSFTAKNLRCIRPGSGLPPKHYESLLGKKANCDLRRGTPMRLEFVDFRESGI